MNKYLGFFVSFVSFERWTICSTCLDHLEIFCMAYRAERTVSQYKNSSWTNINKEKAKICLFTGSDGQNLPFKNLRWPKSAFSLDDFFWEWTKFAFVSQNLPFRGNKVNGLENSNPFSLKTDTSIHFSNESHSKGFEEFIPKNSLGQKKIFCPTVKICLFTENSSVSSQSIHIFSKVTFSNQGLAHMIQFYTP